MELGYSVMPSVSLQWAMSVCKIITRREMGLRHGSMAVHFRLRPEIKDSMYVQALDDLDAIFGDSTKTKNREKQESDHSVHP